MVSNRTLHATGRCYLAAAAFECTTLLITPAQASRACWLIQHTPRRNLYCLSSPVQQFALITLSFIPAPMNQPVENTLLFFRHQPKYHAVCSSRKAAHPPEAIHHHQEPPNKTNKPSSSIYDLQQDMETMLKRLQLLRCPFTGSFSLFRRIARSGPRTGWALSLPGVRDESGRKSARHTDRGAKRNGRGTASRNDPSDTACNGDKKNDDQT